MPIQGQRRRFTTWQVSGAPQQRGVYVLWERDEAIYVGATRVCPHPARREAELLAEFRIANSRLPRCNGGRK